MDSKPLYLLTLYDIWHNLFLQKYLFVRKRLTVPKGSTVLCDIMSLWHVSDYGIYVAYYLQGVQISLS